MIYEIFVDGNSAFSIENIQPMSFTKVKAYGGNPWFTPININPEVIEVYGLKLCNLTQNMQADLYHENLKQILELKGTR